MMHQKMPEAMKHSKGGMCKMCGGGKCNYAHGGSVDEGPSEKANQSGVHKIVPNWDREHNELKHGQSEARYGDEKAKHHEVIGELRSMPNPKLKGLAEGGEVENETQVRPDKGFGKVIQINDEDAGYAEGGDVEMDESDMHDGLGKELMGALESKDHKGVMRCIEAAILNCMNKGED